MAVIGWIAGFAGLMVAEAVVKPIAIKVFDRIVMPQLAEVFEILNENMADWLREKTADEMNDAIVDALAERIPAFEGYSEPIKEYALRRVREIYDPVINAKLKNGRS